MGFHLITFPFSHSAFDNLNFIFCFLSKGKGISIRISINLCVYILGGWGGCVKFYVLCLFSSITFMRFVKCSKYNIGTLFSFKETNYMKHTNVIELLQLMTRKFKWVT